MWLDPVTSLPAARTTQAWTARDWIERTIPPGSACATRPQRMSGAWVEAMPASEQAAAGPLLSMARSMGGMAFGSSGNALAQLGSEVLTSTDVGCARPEGRRRCCPANIEKFTEGLERPASEVMVFLAPARPPTSVSHTRAVARQRCSTPSRSCKGIRSTLGPGALAGQIDPSNPASTRRP